MIYIKDKVLEVLKIKSKENENVTTNIIAEELHISRNNVSTYLNQLCNEGLVKKLKGRPVYFSLIEKKEQEVENESTYNEIKEDSFSSLIGKTHSLRAVVERSKAAMIYPKNGIHSIIYGETGVGKSMIAKYMYDYSIECGIRDEKSPFITFNCADYANNPQLLMGHLFGIEKGAYTGADDSRVGLLEGANGGVLFLDEIHRLPAEGQEMLFTFIDKGCFKKLGHSTKEIKSEVLIISATTQNPKSTLLDTFNRRIPMTIEIPPLRQRSIVERVALVKFFFTIEAKNIGIPIKVHRHIIKSLLLYNCKNNVGQLKSDIKLAVANGYLEYIKESKEFVDIYIKYFDKSINELCKDYRGQAKEVEDVISRGTEYYIFTPIGDEKILKNYEESSYINIKNTALKSENELNIVTAELFNDTKFKNTCYEIKNIIKEDEDIIISEKTFNSLALYIRKVLDGNTDISTLDLNKIRQNNKNQFKTALKIVGAIENEYDIFLSIETAAYITLFIVGDKGEEKQEEANNINIIVAMHGDCTAKSMVKAVNDIIGDCNAIAFDMKLDKSYEEVLTEFKGIIKLLDNRDTLLFTDMGSLNSFDEIIRNELKCKVKAIPMVTTLTVLDAVQKANMGLSLDEVYNSSVNMRKYNIGTSDIQSRENLAKTIIIGSQVERGIDMDIRNILKDKLGKYLDNIDIIDVSYKTEKGFSVNVAKFKENSEVFLIINNEKIFIKGIDYINEEEIKNGNAIDKIKMLIKISRGYDDVVEGLKVSLINSNYSRIFTDIKSTINCLFDKFNIEKNYDMVIGLMMHLAFMIDGLVGTTRAIEELDSEKLLKYKEKIQIISNEIRELERIYKITINEKECYGILTILNTDI